jgi:TatA/E family protein of Tat protein translocase
MPFGLTPLHLVIVLVVLLIVVGPGRLPEVGASLGRTIREFRGAIGETTDAFKAGSSEPSVAATPESPPTPPADGPPPTAPPSASS